MAKKTSAPIETAPTLPPEAPSGTEPTKTTPTQEAPDGAPDAAEESASTNPDDARPPRCEDCAGLLVLGTQKVTVGHDNPREVDAPALICEECGRPAGTPEISDEVERLQDEAIAEEAAEASKTKPPETVVEAQEPMPVRYYRVTATSRYYVHGQIAELAVESVVSTLTHSLADLRAQNIPLEECKAPQVVDSPFTPQGYILAKTHDFSMEETVGVDFSNGGGR